MKERARVGGSPAGAGHAHDLLRRAVAVARLCLPFVLIAATATGAGAHSWYDGRCCSGRDCHPVPCDELSQERDGGVTFRPTGVHVFRENVLPSQDGQCHLCTSKPEHNEGYGYCAYIRQGS